MRCPNCGKENESDAKFCEYCGAPLSIENNRNRDESYIKDDDRMDQGKQNISYGTARKAVKKKTNKVMIIILIIIVAFCGAFFGYRHYKTVKSEKLKQEWSNAYSETFSEKLNTQGNDTASYAAVDDINNDGIPEVAVSWNDYGTYMELYTYSVKQEKVMHTNVGNKLYLNDMKKDDDGNVYITANTSSAGDTERYIFSLGEDGFEKVSSSEEDFDSDTLEKISIKFYDSNAELRRYMDDKLNIIIGEDLTKSEMENRIAGKWKLISHDKRKNDSYITSNLCSFKNDGKIEMYTDSSGLYNINYAIMKENNELKLHIKAKVYVENGNDKDYETKSDISYDHGILTVVDTEENGDKFLTLWEKDDE